MGANASGVNPAKVVRFNEIQHGQPLGKRAQSVPSAEHGSAASKSPIASGSTAQGNRAAM